MKRKAETNGALKIERGVPIPTDRRHGNSKWSFIDAMVKGDSVLVPSAMYSTTTALVSALSQRAKRRGMKMTIRTVEGGARVWRMK